MCDATTQGYNPVLFYKLYDEKSALLCLWMKYYAERAFME